MIKILIVEREFLCLDSYKKGCSALEQIEDELKIRDIDTTKALLYNPMLLCSTKSLKAVKFF